MPTPKSVPTAGAAGGGGCIETDAPPMPTEDVADVCVGAMLGNNVWKLSVPCEFTRRFNAIAGPLIVDLSIVDFFKSIRQ